MNKSTPFPVHGLLPKEETEAASFLKKYPQYDGRGVLVAILDTGVDPGAPGLQLTPNGQPKLLDIIDCTGSGDVMLKEDVEAEKTDQGLFLTGLSGRRLKLNASSWKNPSGKYRLGLKSGYELFPKNLVSRLTQKQKERFSIQHEQLLAQVQAQLAQWDATVKNADDAQLKVKADLEAQLEALKSAMKNYEDPGPVFDVVAFHDGQTWRAALDTSETGDMSEAKVMADYAMERQWSTFGEEDRLNYSFKFYDDGKVVSIVTNAGAHGTHVAAITAAYFPDDPALNGVAPGAQLVSLKIGDTRLGSMETGTGLTRAINAIIKTGCHLCNMSYGEDSGLANDGHWIELLRDELINKHQVIFVSSAGNAGPALSTAGAPGGTTSGVIGVGAYATSAMIQAEYALLEQVPDRAHTWCSRGPTYDGDKGLTIFAPGAAITSVPQYLLQNAQMMNGTSMSSPNACGNVALMLSALKAQSIPFTPYGIEKAIVNSAKDVRDEMRVGFLQIEQAYEYYRKYHNEIDTNVHFKITIGEQDDRGIYLREWADTNRVYQTGVNVSVNFKEDDVTQNDLKLQYEQRLILVSTESWARAPDFLFLNNGGRDFQVRVDPTQLPPGFHYAEIQAFEDGHAEKGAVFTIPVTVTKPHLISDKFEFEHHFRSGHIERRFVSVPEGSHYARITLKADGSRSRGRLSVHLLQMVPQLRHTHSEHQWYLNVNGDDSIPTKTFKVVPGVTMEVCIAQFWSSLGDYTVKIEMEFVGVHLKGDELSLFGGDSFKRVDISSALKMCTFSPSISLDRKRNVLRPCNAVLQPLLSRDILPNGKVMMELILSYQLKLASSATVTLRKPVADNYLYDSFLDSTLMMVHDLNKRMITFGDIYPKPSKLEKGEYTVRLQLRHADFDTLDNLKTLCLLVDTKLESSVSLDLYSCQQHVFSSSKKALSGKMKLDAGCSRPVFIDCRTKSVKDVKAGDFLVGEFKLGESVEGGSFPVTYCVPPEPNSKDTDEDTGSAEVSEIALAEAVRDVKLKWVKKFSDKLDIQTKLLAELKEHHPESVEVLIEDLEAMVASMKSDEERALKLDDVQKAVDKLVGLIDEQSVVAFFGAEVADDSPANTKEYKKQKKDFEDKKKKLGAVYYRSCESLVHRLNMKDLPESDVSALTSRFDIAFAKYQSFSNKGIRFIYIAIARERLAKRFGVALQILNKYLATNEFASITNPPSSCSTFVPDSSDMSHHRRLVRLKSILLQELQWNCWTAHHDKWTIRRFPADFASF